MGTEVRNIIEDVLSACVSSAKAEPIVLHEWKGKRYLTRSQVHVLFIMPFGTHKTTILNQMPGVGLTEFTAPGLLGTISREGEYTPGLAIKAAGQPLKVDEHQKLTYSARSAMLNLLEGQPYDRNLGYSSKKPYNKSKKNLMKIRLKAGDNYFSIFSRFSCICAGMWKTQSGQADDAWISRFIPANLILARKDIYNIYRGKPLFNFRVVNDYENPPEFTKWLRFVDLNEKITDELCSKYEWARKMDGSQQRSGFFGRIMSDLARLICFYDRSESEVKNYDFFTNYLPYFCYNLATSSLTQNEYNVFSMMVQNRYTVKDIETETGLCNKTIYNIGSKLNRLGLFKGGELCKM